MTAIGFTGSRRGLTARQAANLEAALARASQLHHGDCEGADEYAHSAALKLGLRIVIHPPVNPRRRAHCSGLDVVVLHERPYLSRNRSIVDMTDELIACPDSGAERLRSGTWATVRYARLVGKPVTVLLP